MPTAISSAARGSFTADFGTSAPAVAVPQSGFWSGTAWVSFWAAFASEFTLPVVGELPAGEILLAAAAAWAMLYAAMNQTWPGALFSRPLFWRLLAAQLIAFVAYVASDLYRHSSSYDMARGWARMVLLGVDLVAITFLLSWSRRNLIVFVLGSALGAVASALTIGPLFGDMWKFGVGAPITFVVFLIAPALGPIATLLAGVVMGVVHFALDYRSFGGLCIATGALSVLQMARPSFRLWLAPLGAAAAIGLCVWAYQWMPTGHRTTRSDVERSAMVQAAAEAVQQSPLIGHGSWFSNSDVYDNFMRIRFAKAREAHVGGFADPNKRPDAMTLHSQILVALAEGGLFGGAFFLVFGGALLWTLCDLVLARPWHRLTPLYTLLLIGALWDLFLSPFSGAQRVRIAFACGLILRLQLEAAEHRRIQVTQE